MSTAKKDISGFHIRSFIWKPEALEDAETLHIGLDNCCYIDNLFNLFLDCDDIPLRNLFHGIADLRIKFEELEKEELLILQSSPFHFSVVAFTRISWQRYKEMLWYAVKIGICHEGYAFYTTEKGYAVLRIGAKDGIVPRAICFLGDKVTCKKCKTEFFSRINSW